MEVTLRQSGAGDGSGAGAGGLFQGMSFWFSATVPQRNRFKELVRQNGGTVKLFEKDADVQIVDHKKKNTSGNVYSYQFIEKSIQKGRLEDLETHRAGPSTARPVGATHIPTRGHRLPFTLQDDQDLWDYMQPFERNPSAPVRGNKIFEELEAKNPRHPFQSWRDRYLRRIRGNPRPGGIVDPAANKPLGDETRRSPRPQAATSHRAEAAAESRNVSRPQDKKRKRSPKPTILNESADGRVPITQLPSTQQRSAPTQQSTALRRPAVVVPLAPRISEKEPSHIEAPPSPKRPKITPKPSPAKTTASEPVRDISIGIDSAFLELPFLPPSPEADEAPAENVDSWIEDRLSMGKGSEAQIIEALQCTSLDTDLADKVLESLVAGKGIPTDMPGVWTAQDDEGVEAQDTREIERVLEKHGQGFFAARWDYLDGARKEGLLKPTT
ncbi:TRF2-interacting telomeric protein/Rap1 C terminal domain-containing protein [Aspergillus crustosus]